MSGPLSHLKKEYRARFCHGERKTIDVQPGQNVLKLVQDCFESCVSDLTISSPSEAHCSTPIVRNKKTTSVKSKRPKSGLTNSAKRACKSPQSLPASPLKPVSSRGCSHDSHVKPTIRDDVAVSETTKSSVSKREADKILEDIDVVCKSPALSSDSENDQEGVGSPLLVHDRSSPVHTLHFDDQNAPAEVKSHGEVENLEGIQAGRDEQVVLVQETEHDSTSSVQKEKSFSLNVLAAVTTGTLGKRYSASVSPPSPPLVKDPDQEIEDECDFLIDDSLNSWLSIPQKKKNKSKKDTSATPVPKSQPSEKEKTERKNGKTNKVQAGALIEQKVDDLDVRVRDFRGTAESDPASNSERKVLKSKRQNRMRVGKTKKDAVKQGSPNQKKDTSWKPEPEEMMSSPPGLQTKASHAEQCKTMVVPSNDSPVPSAEHQQEQAPKKIHRSFKNLQLVSKASQNLVHKKQTAQQKLPKDTVAKRLTETPGKKLKKSVKKRSTKKPQLQRKESSNSEHSEEELEREPVKMTEAFTPPSRWKLQPVASQMSRNSEKPNKVLQPLESLGAGNKTLIKALEYFLDSVKKSGKKQLPAESSGKLAQIIHHRTSEGVCSNPEDAESQADSDSSSVRGVARKKQKLSDVKRKSNKRKRNIPRELQDSIAAEKGVSHESGPVLECHHKLPSRSKSSEENNASSDSSEDLDFQGRPLLSDNVARHKIVMPTHTPNVRRTKRVRVKPLEYWRGERINYTMSSSGLVISGIMCPETKPHRKIKQRRDGHKQKMDETRSEIPANLDHILADTSKPTVVLDPITNKEVLLSELRGWDRGLSELKCINTDIRHECFFKDEAVEVYKNLNTSAFATGRLILKPLKEKGRQFVHMDTIAFHVIRGKIIFTLHETSYSLTTGSCFYVPAGNEYNIRNILNEESVLFFTQLKAN